MRQHFDVAELRRAYAGKRVLLTGHTGFKGAWMTMWLDSLGATVHGFALPPATSPSMFSALELHSRCHHREADIRDAAAVARAVAEAEPDFVFHLAAQALVRPSYERPLETIAVNVMGTAHVLDALRLARRRCSVVIVTSDKCYENREWLYGYRETDAMGGHDVYSMSKGATELVTASYRHSFFPRARLAEHGIAVASARAGNVIGGGDWAVDRILPDAVRALAKGQPIHVRNPRALRPWQHVLEPLAGYLILGARLTAADGAAFADAWNFGPVAEDARTVRNLVEQTVATWGTGTWEDRSDPSAVHEASLLRLSIEKATTMLGWRPRWAFERTVQETVLWYKAQAAGASAEELRSLTLRQLHDYVE